MSVVYKREKSRDHEKSRVKEAKSCSSGQIEVNSSRSCGKRNLPAVSLMLVEVVHVGH